MAAIDSEKFYLLDQFPGTVNPGFEGDNAYDGFDGLYCNVAAAKYPLGTKIQRVIVDPATGVKGSAIFMYAQAAGTIALAALCGIDGNAPYVLSTDGSNCAKGPVAVACKAMTANYYGWFWVGGVCPEVLVSGLGTTYLTDGNVVKGAVSIINATDVIQLGAGVAGSVDVGIALSADA